MVVDIDSFLNKYDDFDIRQNHDARYVDQKCTPDIVCFIADCIISTSCATKHFSVSDLWEERYFIDNCRVIFGKPSPSDPSARNEYNKVLCQPLKLLSYAHVLQVAYKGKQLDFCVNDETMLEYIATKERNAYNFMLKFFMRVVEASGITRIFEEYKATCEANSRAAKVTIYEKYHRFISANTPSHSKTDVDRIFHKVFNLYAYSNMLPGSNGKLLDWYDLMYNRVNWRDKDKKKKSLTREQAVKAEIEEMNQNFYIDYQVNKAIRKVRQRQGETSEVNDELSSGIATEVHHIFPKSQFPELASYFENLILLTSSQHRQKAHPRSNFQLVDREYQLVCLMAKSRSVENYIEENGESFYSKKSFVYVVNTGTDTDELNETATFDKIRRFIHEYYNLGMHATVRMYTEVEPSEEYSRFLPLYSLRAACGKFLHNETPEIIGWIDVKEIDSRIPVGEDCFVVKAVGDSMLPAIHDGEYCVFRHKNCGFHNTDTMLFEIPNDDPDTGGGYTIKEYIRTKVYDEEMGRERIESIKLMPRNNDYTPYEFSANDCSGIHPVGTLVGQFNAKLKIV